MGALFGRWYPRDYLDVDAALARYTREQLLGLAAARDPGFDSARFREALAELQRIPDRAFASYGVSAHDVAALRQRFASWHAELGQRGAHLPSWRPTTASPATTSPVDRDPPAIS